MDEDTSTPHSGETSSSRPKRQSRKVVAYYAEVSSGESGNDEQDSDDDHSPPPKKKARKNASGQKTKGKRRDSGKLSKLMQMPIDIFMEIVCHVEAIDLLNLSRTSKFMRSLLMSRRSRGVWRYALACVEDLPECPADLSEPAYTFLVFGLECQACGSTKNQKPDYYTRIRSCPSCFWDLTIRISQLSPHSKREDSDRQRLKRLLNATSYSTKGIRYNLATANETIASLHVVKHDPDALKQFLAEREELAAVIKENASDLTQWKHQLGRVKSLKDIELTKRRKSSILENLEALGWTKDDISHIPWQQSREFQRWLNQPKELTPLIWNRLRPKMVDILEDSKVARLERERLVRVRDRHNEISNHMDSLVEKSYKREIARPFSAKGWASTFPVAEDCWLLPSMSLFLDNDDMPITEAAFEACEDDILADIKIHQMKIRRKLVAMTIKADAGQNTTLSGQSDVSTAPVTDTTVDEGVSDGFDQEDLETLEANDKENLSVLLDPTMFFTLPYSSRIMNYPEIAGHLALQNTSRAAIFIKAIDLAKSIIDESPSISALDRDAGMFQEDTETGFVCTCCPKLMRKAQSWAGLITHFLDEAKWYDHQVKSAIMGPAAPTISYPPPQILADHAQPKAVFLAPKELDVLQHVTEAAQARDKSTPSWICRCCVDQQWRWGMNKKGQVIMHLSAKHGIKGKDCETHMERSYNQSVPEIPDDAGCQCEYCLNLED